MNFGLLTIPFKPACWKKKIILLSSSTEITCKYRIMQTPVFMVVANPFKFFFFIGTIDFLT